MQTQPQDHQLDGTAGGGVVTLRGHRAKDERPPPNQFSVHGARLRQSDMQRLGDLRAHLEVNSREPSFTVLVRAALAALHRDLMLLPPPTLHALLNEARALDHPDPGKPQQKRRPYRRPRRQYREPRW